MAAIVHALRLLQCAPHSTAMNTAFKGHVRREILQCSQPQKFATGSGTASKLRKIAVIGAYLTKDRTRTGSSHITKRNVRSHSRAGKPEPMRVARVSLTDD